jgi:N-acetyl-gamma-glutamyl-phosphate reductase
MHKIFIDGAEGTTGLRLSDRLSARQGIDLLVIDPDLRKDPAARLDLMLEADISFLCLPDAGAEEIVAAIDSRVAEEGPSSPYSDIRLVDCSTAHRTAPGWAYGLPEIAEPGTPWTGLKRVSNPGCHATGFIVAVRPLVEAGLVSADEAIAFHSLTGYSGGGKKMIAEYEDGEARKAGQLDLLAAPRQYGLGQEHKHLPEMTAYSGLRVDPVFAPIVGDFYCGMLASIPIMANAPIVSNAPAAASASNMPNTSNASIAPIASNGEGMAKTAVTAEKVHEILSAYYECRDFIKVRPLGDDPEGGFLSAVRMADRDDLEIFVFGADGMVDGGYGHPPRLTVVTRFDNLGKGASGAAIQNMNLMLGLPEKEGLILD